MQLKSLCEPMARLRRKDGASSSSRSVSPWLAVLLVLVMLGINFQSTLRLEQMEMADGARKTSLKDTSSRFNSARQISSVAQQPSTPASANPPQKPRVYFPIAPRSEGVVKDLVQPGDYIYYHDPKHPRWDSSPIVIESHKLIFFTIPKVGCTVWKQLFRRMMGSSDWKSQDYDTYQPHNPAVNGLKYLHQYTLEQASEMMTSPQWTRAIMVRDPKMRFLSAFLDKSVSNDHTHIIRKCCPDKSCVEGAQTIPGFLALVKVCDDEHWQGQNLRVDSKYWPYIDYVSHVETAAEDARELLEKIGAWEEFGQSGWGQDGKLAIFESTGVKAAGGHATWSQWKVWQWYTPDSEKLVERHYQEDYVNPLFHFERDTCLTCEKETSL
uniref:Carbohydrate sulfotransferase n=1 Tax=Amphora coffeiformis TaxID=265554 RepID=A0A7S3PBZ5_9STRA|mmetsp:Transcript_5895/g.11553  ORF Transcript_5895/g.11553 Transcript_5895/m.11553 type:complete len:382 (+) Transcript_5895:72-1217(+)